MLRNQPLYHMNTSYIALFLEVLGPQTPLNHGLPERGAVSCTVWPKSRNNSDRMARVHDFGLAETACFRTSTLLNA